MKIDRHTFSDGYKHKTSNEDLEYVRKEIDAENRKDKIRLVMYIVQILLVISFWITLIYYLKR